MTSILFEPDGSLFDQQKSDISSLFFFFYLMENQGVKSDFSDFCLFLVSTILFFFSRSTMGFGILYWFYFRLCYLFYEKLYIICTFGSISLVVKKVSMKYSGDDWFLWSFRINCM